MTLRAHFEGETLRRSLAAGQQKHFPCFFLKKPGGSGGFVLTPSFPCRVWPAGSQEPSPGSSRRGLLFDSTTLSVSEQRVPCVVVKQKNRIIKLPFSQQNVPVSGLRGGPGCGWLPGAHAWLLMGGVKSAGEGWAGDCWGGFCGFVIPWQRGMPARGAGCPPPVIPSL